MHFLKLISELKTMYKFNLPWPTLKSCDNKKSEHCFKNVVIVKLVPRPQPLINNGGPIHQTILVHEELPLAGLLVQHGPV